MTEQFFHPSEGPGSNRVIGNFFLTKGRGSCQVVSVLALYSDDPNSNTVCSFNMKIILKE